jgi:DeoR/GlpR family transcriptional regulator of sugar metabolism
VLAEQRQSIILDLVNQRGAMSITEMQRKFKVSRETIRRDVMLLAERSAVRRTHGGAVALKRNEPAAAPRPELNVEAKLAIGRFAAGLVPDNASVMLGGGSTVEAVADALADRRGLTVYTNSLAVCGRLAGRNDNRVHMLGGEIRDTNRAALGPDAMTMLARYFADFAFVGIGAISSAGWLMDYSRDEADLYGLMLRSAKTSVVVADHSKFNQHAPVRVTSLEEVNCLVSDRKPVQPLASVLSKLPIQLSIVR